MFKFSHLPLTVPPIGSLSNHTVLIAKKKNQTNEKKNKNQAIFFRQIGIRLREAGTDEVIGRTGGGGFRLHLQECVPRPQRDLRSPAGSRLKPPKLGSGDPQLRQKGCCRATLCLLDADQQTVPRPAAPHP